jgi:hypothetical protein
VALCASRQRLGGTLKLGVSHDNGNSLKNGQVLALIQRMNRGADGHQKADGAG